MEQARALGRPAMSYVREQLRARLSQHLSREYLRWLHPTSRRRPGAPATSAGGQVGVDPTAADEATLRPTGVDPRSPPERTATPVRRTGDDRPAGAPPGSASCVVARSCSCAGPLSCAVSGWCAGQPAQVGTELQWRLAEPPGNKPRLR